ncbi:MAG TPA: hypothetical protein DCM14_05675, partial [Clostridiales bacterium UBA8153]|nr:hypothetical protein [Clostridiales bacterium UBA8153]
TSDREYWPASCIGLGEGELARREPAGRMEPEGPRPRLPAIRAGWVLSPGLTLAAAAVISAGPVSQALHPFTAGLDPVDLHFSCSTVLGVETREVPARRRPFPGSWTGRGSACR